jgi:hypothetical protein
VSRAGGYQAPMDMIEVSIDIQRLKELLEAQQD